jgi:two-component system chemotaxis response regulator CheB
MALATRVGRITPEVPGDKAAIRVFLVDDSAVVRRIVTNVLSSEPDISLAGSASNGRQALERIGAANPDVVVLDVEMPEMDGRETLVQIRRRWPALPVIMFSSQNERAAAATFEAMASGAKDFVPKPSMAGSPENAIATVRANLVSVVRAWGVRTRKKPRVEPLPKAGARPSVVPAPVRHTPTPVSLRKPSDPTGRISAVVMASSTGGPNALVDVIPHLPGDLPVPVLLVQHMPPTFTRHLAQRLDANSALTVLEAEPGLPAKPGHLYVAQGGKHMVVSRGAGHAVINLDDGPPENSCKPAADVLFRSAVNVWGGSLLAVVLTGMGQDGLIGSRAVIDAGGTLIAQDEESSVVWGMPGAVAKAGLASEILPLKNIAASIARRVNRQGVA